MYLPLLTVRPFSTPFLSKATVTTSAVRATKANIALIHDIFITDPPLRKWRYYCYYNFMATLVLLILLKKYPLSEDATAWVASCQQALDSFTRMAPMGAAAKSSIVCQTFLDERASRNDRQGLSSQSPLRWEELSSAGIAPRSSAESRSFRTIIGC